jgi:hypothetical protein
VRLALAVILCALPAAPTDAARLGLDSTITSLVAGPDGGAWVTIERAWFTLGRCELARVGADGKTTFVPAPLPALELAFGPGDALWLASERRLARTTIHALTAQGCDGRAPRLTAGPRRSPISLAALRSDGLRLRTDEPALVDALVTIALGRSSVAYRAPSHRTPYRLRLNARRLRLIERALARGRRPEVSMLLETRDYDGNCSSGDATWRITA